MNIEDLEANPLRMKIGRWSAAAMRAAFDQTKMSKDPNTRVGSVLVFDRQVISPGFNGFPRGIADTPDRLNDRTMKNELVVHAEHNAVLNAARRGISTVGATCYLIATDDSGEVWGGPPCLDCCKVLIQAGIVEVRSLPFKPGPSKWLNSVRRGRMLLHEAGIPFVELFSDQGEDPIGIRV